MRWLRLGLFFAPTFFILGIWWSLRQSELRDARLRQPAGVLAILCPNTWIPDEVLDDYFSRTGVQVTNQPVQSLTHWMQAVTQSTDLDVVCVESSVAAELVVTKIFKKINLVNLDNYRHMAVDFRSYPFDRNAEYLLPLHWGLMGFLHSDQFYPPETLQAVFDHSKRGVAMPMKSLGLLSMMERFGLMIENWEEPEKREELESFAKSFLEDLAPADENSVEQLLSGRLRLLQMESGPAAQVLAQNPQLRFWLPQDSVSLWIGFAAVKSTSQKESLALSFFDYLLSSKAAKARVLSTGHASVMNYFDNDDDLLAMQKAQALRATSLSSLNLSQLPVEPLREWESIIDETLAEYRKNQDGR